jgi:hypothetical protein
MRDVVSVDDVHHRKVCVLLGVAQRRVAQARPVSQLRRYVLFGGVTRFCDESVHAYSDLSWLGLIGFGNLYFKYSVPIGCFDAIVFHGLRQVEGSRKFTCNPLDPVVLDPIGRLVKLSLATEGQYPFVHFRFEVLVSHPGQLGANEIRILTFKNVHGRIPDSSGSTLLRPCPTKRVFLGEQSHGKRPTRIAWEKS